MNWWVLLLQEIPKGGFPGHYGLMPTPPREALESASADTGCNTRKGRSWGSHCSQPQLPTESPSLLRENLPGEVPEKKPCRWGTSATQRGKPDQGRIFSHFNMVCRQPPPASRQLYARCGLALPSLAWYSVVLLQPGQEMLERCSYENKTLPHILCVAANPHKKVADLQQCHTGLPSPGHLSFSRDSGHKLHHPRLWQPTMPRHCCNQWGQHQHDYPLQKKINK